MKVKNVVAQNIGRVAKCFGYAVLLAITAKSVLGQAKPTITWATPAAITYGTPLSATQLNAKASVAGAFAYSPASGTVLTVGTQTLSVTFTPTDTTDYTSATATVTLTVVTPGAGIILTVAGNGTTGYTGDGGLATSAEIDPFGGIAVDATGNIYIADGDNSVIRKVTVATGDITTVAGNGTAGDSGDGGLAISAELNSPSGVAVDSVGNIYFCDIESIRKVTVATGIITTVAGNGTEGYTGDGGLATSAELSDPYSMAVDSVGNIYIADTLNQAIRKVTVATGIITTVAGNGTRGYTGDGGLATSAELSNPYGVTVDATGNIYFSDYFNNRIRKVTASTGYISTVAGNGTAGYSGDGGPATSAKLESPEGIAVDATGNIYFSDYLNNRIRKVTASTGYISTLAGNGTAGYSGDGGPATSAETDYSSGVAVDTSGNIYIADLGNARIREVIASKTTSIITWAAPAAISYGTALSATQLNAKANVPGTFAYSPASGTVLAVGTQTLSVTFTPTYTKDYTSVTTKVSLVVNPAQSGQNTPAINWATPAAISYGTALSSTQLNASASYGGTSVPGTFEYTPAAGEFLDAGSQSLLVTFFPTDSIHYAPAGGSVSILVNPSSTQILPIYSYSITNGSGGSGYAANSNILNYTDSVNGTWSFSYDSLNRLISGTPAAGNNLCWSYDSFGNRTAQSSQSAACPTLPAVPTPTVSYNANNQITGGYVVYDPSGSGNVTGDANTGNTYLYDGEGRICAVKREPISGTSTMTQYIYDAEGTRVAKGTISNWAAGCDTTANGFVPTNSYVLGSSNEQLTETDGNGNWKHSNVYAAGMLIATYDISPTGSPALHFQLADWLGTRRVQTDISGNTEETFASLAFGDGQTSKTPSGAPATADDATEQHFTGKERDTESGNDYFGARYYGSSMGRFMTPDPSTLEYADPENPQSLNLYAYVQNNPLVNVDPDGLDCVYTSNLTSTSVSVTTVRGDCINAGGKDDNGVFVDGTINADSYKAGVDKNGDVELTFGVQTEDAGSSGTGDNATIKSSGNAGMIDIGKAVNPDTEISPWAMSFIQQTNQDNQHKIGCIAQAYGVGGAGLAAHQSGQPYFAKPFAAPGAAADTSAFSKALGGLGKMPFRVPTPMGGPGTGVPFRWAKTANLGRAAGRYAPAVGIATTAYAAYQLGNCY